MDRSKVAWQPKITCGKLRSLFDNLAQPSGSNSMVECQLPKLKVAGSIPVSRSSNYKYKAAAQTSMFTLRLFDLRFDSVCESVFGKHKGSKDRRVKDRLERDSRPTLNPCPFDPLC